MPFYLLILLILVSLATNGSNAQTPSACAKTPHPQLCSSLSPPPTPQSSLTTETPNIRNLTLKATKDQVVDAIRSATARNLDSVDRRTRSAWSICLDLYSDTIHKLDRLMSVQSSPTFDDTQTWISAAMANHQTCQDSFTELNLDSQLVSSPFKSENITRHLSNLLAINKEPESGVAGNRRLLSDGLPKWVSVGDRRLLQSNSIINADMVVAKDGTGNYRTISDAVANVVNLRNGSVARFVIYVKAGVYNESVTIPSNMNNVMMIGDGVDSTVVTGSRNVVDGWNTLTSATFTVHGDGFIARNMTFVNTAGPQKQQAVAVVSSSDLSVFYSCSFKGYQDTLFVFSQRQFYRNCDIYGTVDFIFGDAVVVFQSCNIYVRRPLDGQPNVITAQGRTDLNENTGISIHNCMISAAPDLKPVEKLFKTYLGRPWKLYSRTVYMTTNLGSLIDPAGWFPWSGDFALSTLYYGEYVNFGLGANTTGRVHWPGFHIITNSTEASVFTVGNFLAGAAWIPSTGTPYRLGL